jgi:hypothetical protein
MANTSSTLTLYTGYFSGDTPVVANPQPFDVAKDLSTGNLWQYTGAAWVAPAWQTAITFYLGAAATVCERLQSADTKIPEIIHVYYGTDDQVPPELGLSAEDLAIKHDIGSYTLFVNVLRTDVVTDTVVDVPFPEGYVVTTEDGNWTILKNFTQCVGFDQATVSISWCANAEGLGTQDHGDFITSSAAQALVDNTLTSGGYVTSVGAREIAEEVVSSASAAIDIEGGNGINVVTSGGSSVVELAPSASFDEYFTIAVSDPELGSAHLEINTQNISLWANDAELVLDGGECRIKCPLIVSSSITLSDGFSTPVSLTTTDGRLLVDAQPLATEAYVDSAVGQIPVVSGALISGAVINTVVSNAQGSAAFILYPQYTELSTNNSAAIVTLGGNSINASATMINVTATREFSITASAMSWSATNGIFGSAGSGDIVLTTSKSYLISAGSNSFELENTSATLSARIIGLNASSLVYITASRFQLNDQNVATEPWVEDYVSSHGGQPGAIVSGAEVVTSVGGYTVELTSGGGLSVSGSGASVVLSGGEIAALASRYDEETDVGQRMSFRLASGAIIATASDEYEDHQTQVAIRSGGVDIDASDPTNDIGVSVTPGVVGITGNLVGFDGAVVFVNDRPVATQLVTSTSHDPSALIDVLSGGTSLFYTDNLYNVEVSSVAKSTDASYLHFTLDSAAATTPVVISGVSYLNTSAPTFEAGKEYFISFFDGMALVEEVGDGGIDPTKILNIVSNAGYATSGAVLDIVSGASYATEDWVSARVESASEIEGYITSGAVEDITASAVSGVIFSNTAINTSDGSAQFVLSSGAIVGGNLTEDDNYVHITDDGIDIHASAGGSVTLTGTPLMLSGAIITANGRSVLTEMPTVIDSTNTSVTLPVASGGTSYIFTQPLTSLAITNVISSVNEDRFQFTLAAGGQVTVPLSCGFAPPDFVFEAGKNYLMAILGGNIVAGEYTLGQ